MARYNNLMELAEAFRNGQLDAKKYVLRLDNDHSFLDVSDDFRDGLSDRHLDRLQDECSTIYNDNSVDVQELCDAAGIPSEWV